MKPTILNKAILCTSLFVATQTFAQEVVTLKVHHMLSPASNAQVNLIKPWCDKIAKESNGGLKCQIYPSMQLGGTPPQLFDQMRDGTADIVWAIPTYQAGRFTKSEVFELPFMTTTAEKGSPALWEYIQKNAMDEYKGSKLILAHVHDGAVIHLGSKSVKTLEDMKGLKLRGPTRIGSKVISALGAVPVQTPAPAVPELIAKGVFDGALMPWEVVTPLKIQEIVKFHVEVPANKPNFSNTIFVMAMNQAKYDKLSPALKKVIDNNSGLEASRWAGKVFDGPAQEARKIAINHGNTITSLSDAEYARWVKATEGVVNEWIADVNKKGADGQRLYQDAKALAQKYQ